MYREDCPTALGEFLMTHLVLVHNHHDVIVITRAHAAMQSRKQLWCTGRPGQWACGAALTAVLLTGSIPHASDSPLGESLSFWLHLLPQVMGNSENSHPKHPRRESHANTRGLTALPNDINAVSNPEWLLELRHALASTRQPTVIRGLINEDPHFGNLTDLTISRLKELYGQVYLHMHEAAPHVLPPLRSCAAAGAPSTKWLDLTIPTAYFPHSRKELNRCLAYHGMCFSWTHTTSYG